MMQAPVLHTRTARLLVPHLVSPDPTVMYQIFESHPVTSFNDIDNIDSPNKVAWPKSPDKDSVP
jgi:hypothetical protein